MTQEKWHQARLIPTSGISGAEEQERRATSALLAVAAAVKEFGRALTVPFGAPRGKIDTYIEVPFTVGDRRVFPDGLIRVGRGSTTWTALVEVKTGDAELDPQQLETYIDVARESKFDCVITISNHIPPIPGQHPVHLDKRKLRNVALHHLSWSHVLTEAVMQKEHRGVADPDQAWILGELIRYLEHPRSGALQFKDMGGHWVEVREAVTAGTLRPTDPSIQNVVARWDALLRHTSLQLGRTLGEEVTPALSRRELLEPTTRQNALTAQLCSNGTLSGTIRIPGAVGPIDVSADLRTARITCQVTIPAPNSGRSTTRIKWLLRQLTQAPETLRLEAFTRYGRGTSSAELLKDVRLDPALLIVDQSKEIRAFRVALTRPMGLKRGAGQGGFITSVDGTVNAFYSEVMQFLKAWRAAPPGVRTLPGDSVESGSLSSTALSSQDGAITEGATASAGGGPSAQNVPTARTALDPKPALQASSVTLWRSPEAHVQDPP